MGNVKQLIYDLRYGHKNIVDLSDDELENLLDYNLPEDVRNLCTGNIYDRRERRLREKYDKQKDLA